MKNLRFSVLDFFQYRLRTIEPKKMVVHLLLILLTLLSAICFVRSLRLFSKNEHLQVELLPLSETRGQQLPEISKIEKEEALLLASYERARESLLRSGGRDPFAHLPVEKKDLPVPIEKPPSFSIRGLLIAGSRTFVAVSLEGRELEELLEEGSSFGGGRGEIVAINSKGVLWRWAGELYQTSL